MIPGVRLRCSPHSSRYGVKIVAEVHRVLSGTEASRPREGYVRGYKFGAITRDRITGLTGGNEEAPDPAFMFGHTVSFHFIHTPVIRRARNETFRIGESGDADKKIGWVLVAPERTAGAVVDFCEAIAEVHIVWVGCRTRHPVQARPRVRVDGTVSRLGVQGVRRRLICPFHSGQNLNLRQSMVVNADIIYLPEEPVAAGIPDTTATNVDGKCGSAVVSGATAGWC